MLLCRSLLRRVRIANLQFERRILSDVLHASTNVANVHILPVPPLQVPSKIPARPLSSTEHLPEVSADRLLESLLHNPTPSLSSPNTIFSLLSKLKTSGCLPLLSQKVVLQTTERVLTHLQPDKPLLDILTPLIIKFLCDASGPEGTGSISYRPPQTVHVAFLLSCKLLEIQQDRQALDVLQVLIDTNNIPPEAIYEVNSLSQDFGFIIRSTIIRACLHWGWRHLAVDLLTDMVKSAQHSNRYLGNLVLDTMYTLLETPSVVDIADCGFLMRELHRWANFTIPHGLFRLFYNSAHEADRGTQAESLFAHSRSQSVLETHWYPPPQGRALTWLMRHLTLNSRNMHLGRVLAKEVVENHIPIPLQDRAQFIAITAAHGYGGQARALWERYAVSKERVVVVGNATMMVRMVSLFANLVKKEKAKLPPSTLAAVDVGTSSSREHVQNLSHDAHLRRLKDFTSFAERVVAEFRQTKEPLAHTTHFELTSLARAYFLLGDVTAGFNTLKILIDRKESPDLHDVNVALSAIAEHNPRGAALIIERMVEKGLRPDPITFGTVLRHTVLHGDVDQTKDLIHRAHELGLGQLTQKSLSFLIQHSLKMAGDSRASLRSNLEKTMSIIRSMADSKFICIPNMGKTCIFASLRLDDPIMAYKFWNLLVKDKTERGDREQRIQRQLIASKIRKHCAAGWLSREQGDIMLSQLGEESVFRSARR